MYKYHRRSDRFGIFCSDTNFSPTSHISNNVNIQMIFTINVFLSMSYIAVTFKFQRFESQFPGEKNYIDN